MLHAHTGYSTDINLGLHSIVPSVRWVMSSLESSESPSRKHAHSELRVQLGSTALAAGNICAASMQRRAGALAWKASALERGQPAVRRSRASTHSLAACAREHAPLNATPCTPPSFWNPACKHVQRVASQSACATSEIRVTHMKIRDGARGPFPRALSTRVPISKTGPRRRRCCQDAARRSLSRDES